jgi:transcriptional regulator with XRE-family HTH domain
MIIGKKLRELREQKGLLLRQVAAELEVDTAYISKMEQGKKNIKREFILKLAGIYGVNENDLITIWLTDQVYSLLKNELLANDVLKSVSDLINKTK